MSFDGLSKICEDVQGRVFNKKKNGGKERKLHFTNRRGN